MTTDASWPLQRAILSALRDDAALAALLGAGDRIFGSVEAREETPCVCYGDSVARVWHSATFDGQEHDIRLELFCGEGDAPVRKIAAAVIGLLHDADLPIPGHALIELEFMSSETRPSADGATHCRMEFHGLTVSD